ncbi:alcohol dehydrogenase [Fusarium albosuccineum]|uniref:Alcohol dehydrogenase n=1 Tax=Fusarium albosuccineum TaxID=1237068 RepID=A0A8H4L0J6_9HYPO|nr:alcohol dehydrogenase [Fusarium albosuccineum]
MSANKKSAVERKFKLDKAVSLIKQTYYPSDGVRPLAFINVDNPEQVKDRATQREIRRHVMVTIGQSRRKDGNNPRKRHQVAVATTAPQQVPRPLSPATPSYWGEVKICANFKRLFRAMDMVSKGLLSMTVDDTARQTRKWLYKGPDNLQQASGHDLARSLHEMQQYTDSLSLVRNSIHATGSLASRHGIIGTVLCLAYFDVRASNHEGWIMHMRGLETIVILYGGVEALESHQALRQSLFLTDVLGSLVHDVQPRFPRLRCPSMPVYAASGSFTHKPSTTSSIASLTGNSPSLVIDSAMKSASQLAVLLNHLPKHSVHQMGLDLMIPVCKIAHDILSLPRAEYADIDKGRHSAISRTPPVSAAAELVRISALALVSTVITTTSGDDLYCAVYRGRLERGLLAYTKAEGWAGRRQLMLWALVIQALMEIEPARPWLLDEIMDAMDSLSLDSWDELVSCLHQTAWVTHAAMQEMTRLKHDVEGRLAQNA